MIQKKNKEEKDLLYVLAHKATFDAETLTFTYKAEEYSVLTPPASDSLLVKLEIDNTFPDIHLEELITNLYFTADLMFLAYNATMGKDLIVDVSNRQRSFQDLIDDSRDVMITYQNKCAEVMGLLAKAYANLLKGREEMALSAFDRISLIATQMEEACGEIIESFERLTKDLTKDFNNLLALAVDETKQLKQLRTAIGELKAEQEEQKSLEDDLEVSIRRLQRELMEAKLEAKEESTKAFLLQFFGGLFNAAAAGLNAYISSQDPVSMVNKAISAVNNGEAVPDDKKEELEKKKKELKEKQKIEEKAKEEKDKLEVETEELVAETKKIEEEVTELETKKETLETKKEELEDGEELSEEEQDELDDLIGASGKLTKAKSKKFEKTGKLEEKQDALKTATEKYNKAKTATKVISAAVTEFGNTLKDMGQQAQDTAKDARALVVQIMQKRNDLEDQKRIVSGKVAFLLSMIKVKGDEEISLEAMLSATEVAKVALATAISNLKEAKHFWKLLAMAAQKLADPKVQGEIATIKKHFPDKADRVEMYKDKDFIADGALTCIRWQALHVICSEYVVNSGKLHQEVSDNAGKKTSSIKEASANIRHLSREVNEKLIERENKSKLTKKKNSAEMKKILEITN